MSFSPRRKQNNEQLSSFTPKSRFNSIYITSTKDSPYRENPILPMLPPTPLLNAAKRKSKTQPIVFPTSMQPRYDRSPRKFLMTTNFQKSYKNQTELLNEVGNMHDEKTRYTFQQRMKLDSSYCYDYSNGYEDSKIRTQQILNDHYNREIQKQRKLNRESKAAIQESYNHDLYHEDHIFPNRNKDLRVIPVTNRCDSLYPVKEQQFI